MKINNLEHFLSVTDSGKTATGIVITSHDASISELAADCGCDFVWIDLEHSPLTIVDAMHHVMALRGTNCAPFVRVAWNLPYLLKPVLDLAPAAVIVPMVNNARDAEAAVRACRYPVDGGERGFATRRATGYDRDPLAGYLELSRKEPRVFVQIEHREAVRNIDDILKVEGIGGVCIGPCDLSASYGKTGCFEDPEVSDAIDLVREKTLAAGVLLGGFCAGPFWSDRFMNWKAIGSDVSILAAATRRLIGKK
ncbi:aldolase/citrate lyase family protein [uncultured Victivallis sp.]|uniref:HpcH/HpaI aldolase family protein n=1 Tax=uncultured Victivallis sp. TaxID=354118 RepID=UPI0025FDD15C|nr:aldolase/citrate lyase family protein [uncultured Victivallis sp.]